MADRQLRVPDFVKLFKAHGCSAGINSNNIVVVSRTVAGGQRRFSQHAHKGVHDSFSNLIVRKCRRRMAFDTMPDDEFYAPLD